MLLFLFQFAFPHRCSCMNSGSLLVFITHIHQCLTAQKDGIRGTRGRIERVISHFAPFKCTLSPEAIPPCRTNLHIVNTCLYLCVSLWGWPCVSFFCCLICVLDTYGGRDGSYYVLLSPIPCSVSYEKPYK